MTTAIQSSALLEKFDATAFTQRLFRSDQPVSATDSTGGFSDLLAHIDRNANPTSLQNLFADLNAARGQQYGATYGANGAAARPTPNTILVGYG